LFISIFEGIFISFSLSIAPFENIANLIGLHPGAKSNTLKSLINFIFIPGRESFKFNKDESGFPTIIMALFPILLDLPLLLDLPDLF
jgi:hypothetical protein